MITDPCNTADSNGKWEKDQLNYEQHLRNTRVERSLGYVSDSNCDCDNSRLIISSEKGQRYAY